MNKVEKFLYCLGSYAIGVAVNIITINHEVNRKTLPIHIICFTVMYAIVNLQPILYKFMTKNTEEQNENRNNN